MKQKVFKIITLIVMVFLILLSFRVKLINIEDQWHILYVPLNFGVYGSSRHDIYTEITEHFSAECNLEIKALGVEFGGTNAYYQCLVTDKNGIKIVLYAIEDIAISSDERAHVLWNKF